MLPRNDEELMSIFEQFARDYLDEPQKTDVFEDFDVEVSEEFYESLWFFKENCDKLELAVFSLLKAKRYHEAKTILHKTLEHKPNHVFFKFFLALSYYFSGETLAALSIGRSVDFSKIIKVGPASTTPEMACECPGCGTSFSPSELAIDLSAETNADDNVQTLFQDIHHYKQAGAFHKAIACYETFFAQVGESPCMLVDLAVLYRRVNNLKEAKKTYTRALQGNPSLYKAYRELAATHRLLDEYELAVGVLKKAHKQFPEDDMILLELAAGYFKLGYLSRAVDNLEKALAIDPSIEHSLVSMPDMAYLLNLLHEKKSAVPSS